MLWLTSTTNKILVSHEHETGAEMASTPKDYTFSLMIFFQIERKENREKCKSFQLQSLSLCFSYERKGRERGRNRRSRKKRYIRFFIFCFFIRDMTGHLIACAIDVADGKTLSTFPFSCWCSVGHYLSAVEISFPLRKEIWEVVPT
jgi:hypothetical protein